MDSDKKTVFWMILFGVVRSLLLWFGGKLQGWGVIDSETYGQLITEGTAQVVSYILLAGPIVWSVAQKLQVVEWLKTAFGMPSSSSIAEIPQNASGPGMSL